MSESEVLIEWHVDPDKSTIHMCSSIPCRCFSLSDSKEQPMTQPEWLTIGHITGPATIDAFDIDNPYDEPVRTRLIRDAGSVIVEAMQAPYHAHSDFSGDSAFPESWLWQGDFGCPVIVPDGQSVLMQADRQVKFHVHTNVIDD